MTTVSFRILKKFDLEWRMTLTLYLCSLAVFWHAHPSNSTHTHCQNRVVQSLSAQAHYSNPLLSAP